MTQRKTQDTTKNNFFDFSPEEAPDQKDWGADLDDMLTSRQGLKDDHLLDDAEPIDDMWLDE